VSRRVGPRPRRRRRLRPGRRRGLARSRFLWRRSALRPGRHRRGVSPLRPRRVRPRLSARDRAGGRLRRRRDGPARTALPARLGPAVFRVASPDVPARYAVVMAAAAIGLVACSGPSRDVAVVHGPATSAVVTTKDVLTSIGPSIAYVETPLATGSAVLVDGGYLVTNSHVVDPFAAVTVTLPDGERHDDVPVAGSDVF